MNKLMPTLFVMTIITGILFSSTVVSAESKTTTASITVPEACTMTSINNAPHTATLSPNTYSGASGSEYQNGIGKTTLTAICNDDNGFAIYAIGYTGNSYDSENHNKLVGQSTNVAINTAVYTSGDTTSSWSMKVNKIDDSTVSYNPQNMSILDSFDSWHAVPATYTKVAQYKASTGSSTTDTTLGAKVETTYAAYIASNQPADIYIGQVKYTMVHPYDNTPKDGPITDCPANRICYSPNANDIDGTMGQQTITGTITSATLLASNFSRKGYGFAGWSDRYDYSNDNGAKFYGPQETISFTAGQYGSTNGGLRLYAIWIPSQGSLQDQAKVTSVCNSLTTAPIDGTANLSSVSALTDQRDNDTYAIARLADGNCWMIENLRLDNTAEHNTDGALAQGYGASAIYGNFGGLANAESTGFSSTYSANSLYSNDGSNNTINIGTSNAPSYRMPRYNTLNVPKNANNRPQNPTSNSFADNNTTVGLYSYGNYYTWHAVIADLTFYNNDNQSSTNTSLCPAGWRLPKGGDKTRIEDSNDNDYWKLTVNKLNNNNAPANYNNEAHPYFTGSAEAGAVANKLKSFPNNLLYSGRFSTSIAYSRGSRGYYWTSTVHSGVDSYNVLFYATNVYPGTQVGYKYTGYTIRCIANI